MKQAWDDLKSFVTVAITMTIIVLIIVLAIQKNWDMFQIVFTLFRSIAASVFDSGSFTSTTSSSSLTYYFTKKNNDNKEE